ncbi:EEF1A lysine methyltransferase 2 [Bradysia coprophila]|uniref:EEF1A lysine methyltransferase 2 n=1 Tax=Bradysia coprophila TaxID=38358 RepID=UPI00187D7B74|nr:EEF1A lysine methyltransferase 2 [Bradysia coprophila]
MSSIEDNDEELGGSELGTKEFWQSSYSNEISNYKSHGDVGEVWFDEDSQFRVITWMIKNDIKPESKIIDLGCGNGMMLIELAREGFTHLTGVDYSELAIELSQNIAKDQEIAVDYKVADLLDAECCVSLGLFDIVHDKGTYDAVSLHPDDPKSKREMYMSNVYNMLQDDGLFIITSCNWTETELCKAFVDKFVRHSVIPAPSFKFGGKVGSVVTSIVFKKLNG